MIRTVSVILASVLGLLVAPVATEAQSTGKVYRIGLLSPTSREAGEPYLTELKEGLRQLGYVEGRNVAFEYRFAEGRLERLSALAAEIARLQVDAIVTVTNSTAFAAKQATTTTPVVMAVAIDPVGAGLVASLSKPGGNVTGLASDPSPEIMGKGVELLTEIIPRLSRLGVLWNASSPALVPYRNAVDAAARMGGVASESVEVRGPDDFESAFAVLARRRTGAIIVIGDVLTLTHRRQIVDLAAHNRLPAAYGVRDFVEAGGLMSYGPNLRDLFRQAAAYLDKIFQGTRPADLPVQQPTKFEFVINLKTAKALGLTIPQSLLLRADEVIQ